jgi:phosphate transport system protein
MSNSELAAPVPETAAPTEHRLGFHQQLDEVGQEIVRLAAAVIEAIPRATAILLEQDLEGADYLIASDDEVDARSLDLEERCFQVLALQAPVAVDLRAMIAALKIISEIERSADLAVNICKATRRIYGHELDPRLRGLIAKMGEQAQTLYRAAIDSYAWRDAAKAAALDDMDSLLDGLQRDFYQAIFESQAAGRTDLQVAVQLAMIARFYERIGDHAVNIAERVLYLVTGWLPEHAGAARYRAGAAHSATEAQALHDAPEAQ